MGLTGLRSHPIPGDARRMVTHRVVLVTLAATFAACSPNSTPVEKKGYSGKPPLGAAIAEAELPLDTWAWIPFEDAICADGSTTGLAVNRGSGHDLEPAAARPHADRVRDLDGPAAGGLLDASRGGQQRDEGLGAAVGGGDLRAVDLDVEVVDAEPGRGGHQVLHGLDAGSVAAHRGGVVRVDHAVGRGPDQLAVRPGAECDTRIGRRRGERDP